MSRPQNLRHRSCSRGLRGGFQKPRFYATNPLSANWAYNRLDIYCCVGHCRFAGNGASHWPIGGNPPRMAKPEEGHPNRPSQYSVTAFLCRDESDGGSENISFLPTLHAALPPDKNIGSDGRGADGYRVSGPSMRDCQRPQQPADAAS